MRDRELEVRIAILTIFIVNCAREGCEGIEAYFYQLQIRSADEPMTSFFKVSNDFVLILYAWID
jgi:DNA-directed RNA polymerase subunit M/transcription elongation factor TFIIS